MMWMVLLSVGVLAAWFGVTWAICRTLESRSLHGHCPLDASERWEMFRLGLRTRAPVQWLLRKGYFLQRCRDHG